MAESSSASAGESKKPPQSAESFGEGRGIQSRKVEKIGHLKKRKKVDSKAGAKT
jgi:hypothetical protein